MHKFYMYFVAVTVILKLQISVRFIAVITGTLCICMKHAFYFRYLLHANGPVCMTAMPYWLVRVDSVIVGTVWSINSSDTSICVHQFRFSDLYSSIFVHQFMFSNFCSSIYIQQSLFINLCSSIASSLSFSEEAFGHCGIKLMSGTSARI